ncbi:MAG: hypothetical protein ACR2IV_09610, partial [Bryobacteraceae bacterium]
LKTLGADCDRYSSVEEALSASSLGPGDKCALILSSEHLIEACALAHSRAFSPSQLFADIAHILVYPWGARDEGAKALSDWLGGEVKAAPLRKADSCYSVTRSEMAGPFSGLSFGPVNLLSDFGLHLSNLRYPVETIVSIDRSHFLTQIDLPKTQLFVGCSSSVCEVSAEVRGNLSAADRFSELGPVIFFLRHCEVAFWQTSVRTANIVIDDPDLRACYGFLKMKTLARCVDELGCAVSIGFIPWNYNRTSPSVVELFRARWPSLSLCIHGCDHVRDEFSAAKVSTSRQLIALSLERMRRLSQVTGLACDKVMIFPRGEFSGSAMQALRESTLVAGVNTELIDTQTGRGVKVEELLQPAITAYSGFPLFLRRPPSEPIANFALDLLLGKPCLVGMHHNYFRGGDEKFIALVKSLNALDSTLTWTSLESIVAQTCSIRLTPGPDPEVRLFSSCTRVAPQKSLTEARFSKREPLVAKTFNASVDGRETDCTRQDGTICFPGQLNQAQATLINIEISPVEEVAVTSSSLPYRIKVAARRRLSRIRDNHLSKAVWARLFLGAPRSPGESE